MVRTPLSIAAWIAAAHERWISRFARGPLHRGRPCTPGRDLAAGTLWVRFLDGDHRLPILRLRAA